MSQTIYAYDALDSSNYIQTGLGDYWQQYGLKQAPFEDYPQFGMYYPIPQWQAHLECLQQFCTLQDPVLLIEGELGIGKSMLIAQFLTQLDPAIERHIIKGQSSVSAAQLILEIAREFQLPIELNQPTLREQLNAELNILQQLQKTCVLIIDDADLLPPETLVALVHLAVSQNRERVNLYLILSCELQLENHLGNLAQQQGHTLKFPMIMLNPMRFEETKNYLKHRLLKAGLIGKMPLTKEMMQAIHELSGGIPGRINRVAQQTLIDMLKPNAERLPFTNQNQNDLFKALKAHSIKIMSGALLLVVLVGLWKLQDMYRASTSMQVIAKAPVITHAPVKVAMANPVPLVKPAPLTPVTSMMPSDGNATRVVTTAEPSNATPTLLAQHTPEVSSAEPVNEAMTPISSPKALEPVPPVTMQPLPPTAATTVIDQPDTITSVQPMVAMPGDQASTMPAAEKVMPTQKPASAVAKTTPHPVKSQPAASAAAVPAKDKTTESHLLAMQGYTLQILGARTAAILQHSMEANKISATGTYTFRTQYQGKPWYVLVYGNYDTPQAAKAALKTLPSSVQKLNPWIRPLASVHEAIKQK